MPLLAAEAKLGVLLLPLGVGRPVAGGPALVVLLLVAGQLVLDANIEALLERPDGLALFMDEIQIGLGLVDDAVVESYFRT